MVSLTPPRWMRVVLWLGATLLPVRTAAQPSYALPLPPGTGAPAAPRLTIASDSTCPSGAAVGEALALLCPPAEWPIGSVRVQSAPDVLRVDLMFDEPTRREVEVSADCAARAATVALVIATWTGKLSSEAAGMPVLAGRAASAPGVRAEASVAKATAPGARPAVPAREVGVGLFLAMSGGLAPGVSAGFYQTRVPRGLGWQAQLMLPARRERQVAGGSASWTRPAASLALNASASVGRLAGSVDVGLLGAYTSTSGRGYSVEQSAQALTAGYLAGVRLTFPWARLRVWTDLHGARWLFPQTLAADTPTGARVATVGLPSWDLWWTVGIGYALGSGARSTPAQAPDQQAGDQDQHPR